jgi:hypothetical protein
MSGDRGLHLNRVGPSFALPSHSVTNPQTAQLPLFAMAARTLEATFERMTVNDENDSVGESSKSYSKSKVCPDSVVLMFSD